MVQAKRKTIHIAGKYIEPVWIGGKGVGGGGGVRWGYKCQLSVKILAICQLSVNWLLIINYSP